MSRPLRRGLFLWGHARVFHRHRRPPSVSSPITSLPILGVFTLFTGNVGWCTMLSTGIHEKGGYDGYGSASREGASPWQRAFPEEHRYPTAAKPGVPCLGCGEWLGTGIWFRQSGGRQPAGGGHRHVRRGDFRVALAGRCEHGWSVVTIPWRAFPATPGCGPPAIR